MIFERSHTRFPIPPTFHLLQDGCAWTLVADVFLAAMALPPGHLTVPKQATEPTKVLLDLAVACHRGSYITTLGPMYVPQ